MHNRRVTNLPYEYGRINGLLFSSRVTLHRAIMAVKLNERNEAIQAIEDALDQVAEAILRIRTLPTDTMSLQELSDDHVRADVFPCEEEEEEEGDFYPAWEDPESYGLYHGGDVMQDPEEELPDFDREEEVL